MDDVCVLLFHFMHILTIKICSEGFKCSNVTLQVEWKWQIYKQTSTVNFTFYIGSLKCQYSATHSYLLNPGVLTIIIKKMSRLSMISIWGPFFGIDAYGVKNKIYFSVCLFYFVSMTFWSISNFNWFFIVCLSMSFILWCYTMVSGWMKVDID